MAPTDVIELANRHFESARLIEVCERYGIVELSVFGSVARNEDTPDSDLDLLYVARPDASLGFTLFDLEDELRDIFGRSIDLVSKRALHHLMRDDVLSEARTLYAA